MFIDKTIKKSIVASLIAAIVFFIFLEPTMKLLWNFLNKTSLSIYSKYIDSIYQSAALGHRNDLEILIIIIILYIFLIMMIISAQNISRIKQKEDKKEELKSINNPDELAALLQKRKNEKDKAYKSSRRRMNLVIKTVPIIIPVLFIISIMLIFAAFVDMRLNTSFNQRVNALAPCIEDSQKKVLISKWALMKSKKDYVEIKLIMENSANNCGIELPKELFK